MPRSELSRSEIEAFRARLCEAASRLYAEHGFEGVTLRALARDLGCSPMTPYRYFRDKAEIFAAVRTAAFRCFADSQKAAFDSTDDPEVRLGALADAYLRSARSDPHGYRLMYEMTTRGLQSTPELELEQARAVEYLRRAIALALDAGCLAGDLDSLTHVFWAGFHGVVSLELAGTPQLGQQHPARISPMEDALIEGNRPRIRRRDSGRAS